MKTLPIFRLRKPKLDALDIAQSFFGMKEAKIVERAPRPTAREGTRRVEVFPDGGLWMEDEAKLWKPERTPNLPSDQEAREIVRKLLDERGLFSKKRHGGWAELQEVEGPAGSVAIIRSIAKEEREVFPLDVHVGYTYVVVLKGKKKEDALVVPGVGGGSKLCFKLGEDGQIVCAYGALREIDLVEEELAVVPQEDADAAFLRRAKKGADLVSFRSYLAYSWAPSGYRQKLLVPVYVYSASALVDGQEVPMRMSLVPATARKISEKLGSLTTAQKVSEKLTPPKAITDISFPSAQPISSPADAISKGQKKKATAFWIKNLSGAPSLGLSQNNADRFLSALPSSFWSTDPSRGDAAALKSLWVGDDDVAGTTKGVDTYDFVFYSGHAQAYGWVLAQNNVASIISYPNADPIGPLDRWGRADPVTSAGGKLRWLALAACGPFQDKTLDGPIDSKYDATARWMAAFDGLRLMMGYASVTFDKDAEGLKLVGYGMEGDSIANAWLRVGNELQDSENGFPAPDGKKIYVAVMAVRNGSTNALNDYLPGALPARPGASISPITVADTGQFILIASPC